MTHPTKYGEALEGAPTPDVQNIAERLLESAGRVRYGSVSVTLKIHNGRIVDVTHTETRSTRGRPGMGT